MANWKSTFRIDDIWHKRNGECGPEDWTDKTVHELAKEIARRIERKFSRYLLDGNDCDFNLVEVYESFKDLPTLPEYRQRMENLLDDDSVTDEEALYFNELTPMKEFNQIMDMFYDWCDSNMVWVNK